jgi:hypothetical protein
MSRVEELATPEQDVITTKVRRVNRVYLVQTSQGTVMDMYVDLETGDSTFLTGLSSFNIDYPVQIRNTSSISKECCEGEETCVKDG